MMWLCLLAPLTLAVALRKGALRKGRVASSPSQGTCECKVWGFYDGASPPYRLPCQADGDDFWCYVPEDSSCSDRVAGFGGTYSYKACDCECASDSGCTEDQSGPGKYCYQPEPTCSDASKAGDSSRGYSSYEACGTRQVCNASSVPRYEWVGDAAPETRTYSTAWARLPLAEGHPAGRDVDLLLDVYEPRFSLGGGLRPIAIVLPGMGSSKDHAYYPEIFRNIASYGFLTLGLNYRNYYDHLTKTQEDWFAKDPLEDLKAAVQWAQQMAGSFGADPEKIVLIGTSAGAITIANFVINGWGSQYMMEPGTVRATGILSGRLEPVGWHTESPWWGERRPVRTDGQAPPSYWTYFTGDPLVPADQTAEAIRLIRERTPSTSTNTELWQGINHVGFWIRSQTESTDNLVKWLEYHLGC